MGGKKPGKKFIIRGKTYRAVVDWQLLSRGGETPQMRKGMAIYRCTPKGDKEIGFYHHMPGQGWITGLSTREYGFVKLRDVIARLEERGL